MSSQSAPQLLRQRIITAIIIAPIALAGVFLLPPAEFSIFVGMVVVVSAWEWANLGWLQGVARYVYAGFCALLLVVAWFVPTMSTASLSTASLSIVLSVNLIWWLLALALVIAYPYLLNRRAADVVTGEADRVIPGPIILIIGLLVLVPAWMIMVALKARPDGHYLICLLFFLIWGADIGAYFVGRALGRRKLAPRVSPGKSWAGLIGGVTVSVLLGALMTIWRGEPGLGSADGLVWLMVCGGVAMVSVLGDLAISLFKRNRGIKDASNLLPGHGGFLDRIDSLLAAGPVFVFFLPAPA